MVSPAWQTRVFAPLRLGDAKAAAILQCVGLPQVLIHKRTGFVEPINCVWAMLKQRGSREDGKM